MPGDVLVEILGVDDGEISLVELRAVAQNKALPALKKETHLLIPAAIISYKSTIEIIQT